MNTVPWHQVLARLTVTPAIIGLVVAAIIAAPQVLIWAINHTSPLLTTAGITTTIILAGLIAYQARKETQ